MVQCGENGQLIIGIDNADGTNEDNNMFNSFKKATYGLFCGGGFVFNSNR